MTTVDPNSTGAYLLVWIAKPGTHVPTDPNLALSYAFTCLGGATTVLPIDWDAGIRFSTEDADMMRDYRERANGGWWTIVVDRIDGDNHVREWWNNRFVAVEGDVMTAVAQ